MLDAWNLLNSRWFHCWDCDKPDPKIAKPLLDEIVDIMEQLGMFYDLGIYQHMPRPWVFKSMVSKVLRENNLPVDLSRLDDIGAVGKMLEPLIKKGGCLSKYLYLVRLDVFDPRHEQSDWKI